MPHFIATTSRWLVPPLESELRELGFDHLKVTPSSVGFESNWEGCYKANLCLRTASRVLLPILDFPTYDADDLYNNIRKHDFTKYIDPEGKLSVEATVNESKHRDGRFVAMRIKDAIVDQFRDKHGVRPDVDRDPDLRVIAHVHRNVAQVSIDTSGQSLFKRGYRQLSVDAPLKETLAAAILRTIEWDGKTPIVDLMCGSGTILIEAALMAMKIPPGSLRQEFGFERLRGFNRAAWDKVVNEAMSDESETLDFKFYGFDRDREAVKASRVNAGHAGVGDVIDIQRTSVDLAEPPCERGIVLVNPPYGERLQGDEEDSFKDLGFTLKTRFKGWTAYVLSGHRDVGRLMGLKAVRKYPMMNGNIECRLLRYDIRESSHGLSR